MPDLEYSYDEHGPGVRPAPPAPAPTPAPTTLPPLAPSRIEESVREAEAHRRACKTQTKQVLEMNRAMGLLLVNGSQGNRRTTAIDYLRKMQALGASCGEPAQSLHGSYTTRLTADARNQIYGPPGPPIPESDQDLAVALVGSRFLQDRQTLRGQLTWAEWFVNAMGRRPRW